MLVSDRQIIGLIEEGVVGVDPFDPEAVQPASVDLRLDKSIRVPNQEFGVIDVENVPAGHTDLQEIDENMGYWLYPGEFVLGSTLETVSLPDDLAARVEGKSSLGRLGLAIHVTAGFIDPGFTGQVTLEIVNHSPWTIALRRGMKIGQLCLVLVDEPSRRLYGQAGNHYQNQRGPTESRYRMD